MDHRVLDVLRYICEITPLDKRIFAVSSTIQRIFYVIHKLIAKMSLETASANESFSQGRNNSIISGLAFSF